MNTEHVPREVIENKLLAALDDEGTVAIVASESDLDLLIRALDVAIKRATFEPEQAAFRSLWSDLRKLYRSAFTKGKE